MELKVFDIKISSFNRLKRIKYNYVFDGSILVRNVGLFKKKISSIFFDYYDKENNKKYTVGSLSDMDVYMLEKYFINSNYNGQIKAYPIYVEYDSFKNISKLKVVLYIENTIDYEEFVKKLTILRDENYSIYYGFKKRSKSFHMLNINLDEEVELISGGPFQKECIYNEKLNIAYIDIVSLTLMNTYNLGNYEAQLKIKYKNKDDSLEEYTLKIASLMYLRTPGMIRSYSIFDNRIRSTEKYKDTLKDLEDTIFPQIKKINSKCRKYFKEIYDEKFLVEDIYFD